MADVEAAVYARMRATSGLTNRVGKRIMPPPAPQDSTFPLVLYEEVSRVPLHSHEDDYETASSRIRVVVWADTVAGTKGARNVADQVEAALVGWSQTELLNRSKRWDPDLRKHGIAMDFRVWNTN